MNEKVKEQLKYLLEIIDKLCERQEYSWFKKELQKRFGGNKNAAGTSSVMVGTGVDSNKIDAIYEYCIHDLLKKQAESFFKGVNFPSQTLESIKSSYISMEKAKLYDDFDSFSFYLHKQIDIIFGVLVQKTDFGKIVEKMWKAGCYINVIKGYSDEKKTIYKNIEEYSLEDRDTRTSIAELIFGTKTDEYDKEKRPFCESQIEKNLLLLSSNMKQKILLYFFVYKAKLPKNNYLNFQKDYECLSELVDCRNAFTHEDGNLSDKQRSTFEKVMTQPVNYYFTFIGTYCKLIQGICSYEEILQELRVYLRNKDELIPVASTDNHSASNVVHENQHPNKLEVGVVYKGQITETFDKIAVANYPFRILIDKRNGFHSDYSLSKCEYKTDSKVCFEIKMGTNRNTGEPFPYAINVRPASED